MYIFHHPMASGQVYLPDADDTLSVREHKLFVSDAGHAREIMALIAAGKSRMSLQASPAETASVLESDQPPQQGQTEKIGRKGKGRKGR